MATPKKKKTEQPTSGRDKDKTARQRMAERRSQAQIFKSLDKEDYATIKAFVDNKRGTGNKYSRESRERRNKAEKAVKYLEEKYPTYTKKVKEGKIKTTPDRFRSVSLPNSTVGPLAKLKKPISVDVSTYSAYLCTKKANKYNIKKKGK
jgi:hypothetical protein